MKILLINVRNSDTPSPPLGLMYLASYLRQKGITVKIIDTFFNVLDFEAIYKYKPKIIGLSILTTTFSYSKAIAKNLRKKYKNDVIICAGGIHPTVKPKHTLDTLDLDFIVIGEGELSFYNAIKNIESNKSLENIDGIGTKEQNGNYIINDKINYVSDLDSLPFPTWDLIDIEAYLQPPGVIRSYFTNRSLTMLGSRGCPASCIFCASSKIFGKKIRRRSISNIFSELEYLISEYNIDGFYFWDDTFIWQHEWVINFCKEKINRNIKIPWGCQSRVNTINENLLKPLKESNCVQIDYGVESGSDKVLKALKKGTSVKETIRTFDLTKKYGIRPYASILIGNPDETYEDIIKTKKLLKKIKPIYTSACYITPFPGSELEEIAIKNGWIKNENLNYDNSWDIRKADYPIMEINFTKSELYKIRNEIQKQMFLRNYISFLTFHNLKFLFKLSLVLSKRPGKFIKVVYHGIKNQHYEEIIDYILLNWRYYSTHTISDTK